MPAFFHFLPCFLPHRLCSRTPNFLYFSQGEYWLFRVYIRVPSWMLAFQSSLYFSLALISFRFSSFLVRNIHGIHFFAVCCLDLAQKRCFSRFKSGVYPRKITSCTSSCSSSISKCPHPPVSPLWLVHSHHPFASILPAAQKNAPEKGSSNLLGSSLFTN